MIAFKRRQRFQEAVRRNIFAAGILSGTVSEMQQPFATFGLQLREDRSCCVPLPICDQRRRARCYVSARRIDTIFTSRTGESTHHTTAWTARTATCHSRPSFPRSVKSPSRSGFGQGARSIPATVWRSENVERVEIIVGRLSQPDLVRQWHRQFPPSKRRLASSSETQPSRSRGSPAVACFHSPVSFIRSAVRNAASLRRSSALSAAASFCTSVRDMPAE